MKMLEFSMNTKPVVGLYEDMKEIVKKYVDLQKEAHYGIIAAWIIATYFHRCFNAFPYIFLYGRKGSGKSRLLEILERLCFNAVKKKGVSVAAFADIVDARRATLINDQAEALSRPENRELVGFYADGYTPGGGSRIIMQVTKDKRTILEFETYCPKAFAATVDIDPDLKDRCILIPMVIALRDYEYPEAHLPLWGDMRDKLYRNALTRWKEVREIYKSTGKGMTNRIKELWKPLETILRVENVTDEEIEKIRKEFRESAKETQAELEPEEMEIFDALVSLMGNESEMALSAGDIAKDIMTRRGTKELTPRTITNEAKRVGKRLVRLQLYSEHKRQSNKRPYLFKRDRVKAFYERFQPSKDGE